MRRKQDEPKTAGFVTFVYADVKRNEFITLGGGGWLTEAEVREKFDALPACDESVDHVVADLRDADFDIIDDKRVSIATMEAVLGEPFEVLRRRGLRRNARDARRFMALRAARSAA